MEILSEEEAQTKQYRDTTQEEGQTSKGGDPN